MGKYSKQGKYAKKAGGQRKLLMTVCAVLGVILALLIILLVGMNRDKTPDEPVPGTTGEPAETETAATEVAGMKELLVESVTEQGDDVLVATTYGTVKYPYAFSDLVSVEAENFEEHAVLVFNANIDDTVVKLYSLIINGEEGMPVGTLQLDGDTYTVTAQFHDVSGISDDGMVTFYAAQETINNVIESLSENEGFTAED